MKHEKNNKKTFEELEKEIEEVQTPRYMCGFIPHRLELKNFPQYDNFPYNILFGGLTNIEGMDMHGTAVYFPDFSTFQDENGEQVMIYFNKYNRDWTVEIKYDKESELWLGTKYYKDKSRGGGAGRKNWEMTFAHITMGGLSDGESCLPEKITKQ